MAAVGIDMGGKDAGVADAAGVLDPLHDHRAGAIAEQNAGAAIGPVENAREGLGAQYQHRPGIAAANETVGDR